MEILIVLGSITPDDDANTNIARIVAEEMQCEGHSVSLLGMCFQQCKKDEIIDGVEYHRIIMESGESEKAVAAEYSAAKKDGKTKTFALKHPIYFTRLLIRHFRARFYDYRKAAYVREIQKMCATKSFDRVIAITSPFYVLEAAIDAKTGVDVIWYQLDPNQSNGTIAYQNKTDLLDRELAAYSKVKYAVIPRLVFEENQRNALAVFTDKMRPVEFPNVRKLVFKAIEDDVLISEDTINLLFCGTFYEDIRNPKPLFELVSAFSDDRIRLHIVGGGCMDTITEWCAKSNRIIYHGYHSLPAATNAMLKADVLVNIDNSASNMLPSKINDYISACKPILNLFPGENSNCADYLRDYQYHISAGISSLSNTEIVSNIERFCINAKNCTILFEEVAKDFPFSTPQYVTKQLLEQ